MAQAGVASATPGGTAASGQPVRPSLAVASGCATTHRARWMGCITAADPGFADTPLSEVAIPGAHDSGTFNLDETDFDTQSGSDCTSYSPVFASDPALVKEWSEAQNIDYTRQLDVGVRYFDVRVPTRATSNRGGASSTLSSVTIHCRRTWPPSHRGRRPIPARWSSWTSSTSATTTHRRPPPTKACGRLLPVGPGELRADEWALGRHGHRPATSTDQRVGAQRRAHVAELGPRSLDVVASATTCTPRS